MYTSKVNMIVPKKSMSGFLYLLLCTYATVFVASETIDSSLSETTAFPSTVNITGPGQDVEQTSSANNSPEATASSIETRTESNYDTSSEPKLSVTDLPELATLVSEILMNATSNKNNPSPLSELFTTNSPELSSKVSRTMANASRRNSFTSTTVRPETTTMSVLDKWIHFENLTKIFAKAAVKSVLPGLIEGSGSLNISDSCRRDGLKWLVGIRDIKTWAFSFIDASGKIVDGMLSGTMASLGEFEQCLDIKATNDKRGKRFGEVMFTGQYCALDISPPLPKKKLYYKLNDVVDELKEFATGPSIINEAAKAAQFFHFLVQRQGICVPSGCKASDIQEIVNTIAKDIKWTIKVKRCEVKKDNEYTPLIIGVMTVSSFFGFLLVLGSLIDLYHRYAQKKINNKALEILVSFSFPSNFKKLVNTKNASTDNLTCLHGIRFLSISWVVLGHTYLNTNYVIMRNLKNAMNFQKDFFFQAVVNASVAVDTFFFIGGFLVCYVTIKVVKESKKPFSIVLYLLHRVFRLLPVYIMVILFIFLEPILGSGPVFHDTLDPFMESCYKNWWTNILFVNNYVNTDQICLPQSWYVACDMQLYVAALLVILPILRWPWLGLSIASLGIMASVGGTMALTYLNNYPPTMLFVHPDIEQRLEYWANSYFKPYSHAGPYCIGLIIGYILATHPKLKFSVVTRVIGWTTAIATNMAVLYGVYGWNLGQDPEMIETVLYSGLHRVAWAYGIAWIVLVCAAGQGGVVNYILSWKVWIPLGRLTYTVYLIHPIVQIAAVSNVKMNAMTQHYFIVWIFFGHLMITIGSAFAASMLVEAPFIGLEKILLRAIVRTPKSSTSGHTVMVNGTTEPKTVEPEENDGAIVTDTNHSNGVIPHSNGTLSRSRL